MDKHLRKIRIRRGFNNQRIQVVFEDGEPVLTTDTNRVYVGDNRSYGGILQTHKNKFIDGLSNDPEFFQRGEIAYNNYNNEAYIATNSSGINNLILFSLGTSKGDIAEILNQLIFIDNLTTNLEINCCGVNLLDDSDLILESDSGDYIMT